MAVLAFLRARSRGAKDPLLLLGFRSLVIGGPLLLLKNRSLGRGGKTGRLGTVRLRTARSIIAHQEGLVNPLLKIIFYVLLMLRYS